MPVYHLVENISVGSRQRRIELQEAEIANLARSIKENGLINPVCVLRTEQGKGQLIAGWRRLNAMIALHKAKEEFTFESQPVSHNCIPVSVIREADLPALLELEFAENKERLNLSWQDEAAAIAAIEEARRTREPHVTIKQMAEDITAKIGGKVESHRDKISMNLQVHKALEKRPELAKARNVKEAYKIITRERHEAFEAELTRRKLRASLAEEGVQQWRLILGDCKQEMPGLSPDQFDLILVDPPYGINIDEMKYAPTQMHLYNDDLEVALDLATHIIQDSWRLTKRQANLFLFCDWQNFAVLRSAAARMGWEPWFRPIIWNKSLKEGASPWGRGGFLNTYECLLWATKGGRRIKGPLADVLYAQKVGMVNRQHAAEKPVDFLMQLINISTEVNDAILDPCCGSGSTLDAALRTRRTCVGIEVDRVYYNRAMARLGILSDAIKKNKGLIQVDRTEPEVEEILNG